MKGVLLALFSIFFLAEARAQSTTYVTDSTSYTFWDYNADTVVYILKLKNHYLPGCQIDSQYNYKLTSTLQPVLCQLTTFYWSGSHLDETRTHIGDCNGIWHYTGRILYVPDTTINQDYVGGNWRNVKRTVFCKETVGAVSRDTLVLNQQWDTLTNIWVRVDHTISYYDVQNTTVFPELQVKQNWDGANWTNLNGSRLTMTYDPTHQYRNYQLTQYWDYTNSLWRNANLDSTYYNAGNKLLDIVYLWTGQQWDYNYKHLYYYNPDNKLSADTAYTWNLTSGSWSYNTNSAYGYFMQDYMSEIQTDFWSATTSSWHKFSLRDDTFTACVTSGISEIYEKRLRVFPNPFTDKISIEPQMQYQIFDLVGRQVDESRLSALPAGAYVLKTDKGSVRVIKAE